MYLTVHHCQAVLIRRILIIQLLNIDTFPEALTCCVYFKVNGVANNTNLASICLHLKLLLAITASIHYFLTINTDKLFDEHISETVSPCLNIWNSFETVRKLIVYYIYDCASVVIFEVNLHLG